MSTTNIYQQLKSLSFESKILIVFAFLTLVVGIVGAIGTIHPASIFPEEPRYNSDIMLDSILMSQQSLLLLESYNQSIDRDSILNFYATSLNDNTEIVTFKLADTDNPNRSILVVFTDPNNIVRFSSSQINENMINQKNVDILKLHSMSVSKYFRVRIPDISNSNIDGIWSLNIYVFNSHGELTLVASKPIVSPKSSTIDQASNQTTKTQEYILVGISFVSVIMLYYLFKRTK